MDNEKKKEEETVVITGDVVQPKQPAIDLSKIPAEIEGEDNGEDKKRSYSYEKG